MRGALRTHGVRSVSHDRHAAWRRHTVAEGPERGPRLDEFGIVPRDFRHSGRA